MLTNNTDLYNNANYMLNLTADTIEPQQKLGKNGNVCVVTVSQYLSFDLNFGFFGFILKLLTCVPSAGEVETSGCLQVALMLFCTLQR